MRCQKCHGRMMSTIDIDGENDLHCFACGYRPPPSPERLARLVAEREDPREGRSRRGGGPRRAGVAF